MGQQGRQVEAGHRGGGATVVHCWGQAAQRRHIRGIIEVGENHWQRRTVGVVCTSPVAIKSPTAAQQTGTAPVERVDDHLAVGGARDLHAPVLQYYRQKQPSRLFGGVAPPKNETRG